MAQGAERPRARGSSAAAPAGPDATQPTFGDSRKAESSNTQRAPSKPSRLVMTDARNSDPLPEGFAVDGDLERASENQGVFQLCSAVLSAGVLGMPFAFRVCGLGLATALVLVMLVAAELGMRLLMVASQLASKRSYEELARHSFGRAGQWVVELSVIANNVGSLVAYQLILADLFSTAAGTIIPAGAEPNRNALLLSIMMLGVVPVALFVRSPQLLSSVSQASVGFLLFFCAVVTFLALSTAPAKWQVSWWQWEGALVAFPVVVYSFTAHQALFPIYSTLQRPNLKRILSVIQRSLVMSSALYIVVGACGYIAFGHKTSGNIVRNFGGRGIAGLRLGAEWLIKAGYGVSILATIPLLVIPLQATFAPWISLCVDDASAPTLSPLQENLITLGVLGVSCAMAILLPNVEFVFGLAGSTASVLISFIMPAAIFLQTTGSQRGMLGASVDMLRGSQLWRQRRRMAAVLLLFGVAAGLMCTHALVTSIQEEAEVVQLAQELVREEARVMKATETEMRAKQVAEAVGAVSEAAKQLDSAKVEAEARLSTVVKVAEHLQQKNASGSSGQKKGSMEARRVERAGLKAVRSEVDKTLQALENITATLGATASKLRNETAAASNGTALLKSGAAANASLAAGQAASSGPGTQVAALAQQAEKATVQAVQSLLRRDASEKELQEVAAALQQAQKVSNETLQMVKQSKHALDHAQRARKEEDEVIDMAVQQAVDATTAAAARVNATISVLNQLESEKTSELVKLVHKLADEEETEEQAALQRKHFEQFVAGRKEAIGLGGEASTGGDSSFAQEAARAITTGGTGSSSSSSGAAEGQKVREVLKEIKQQTSNISSSNAINVTALAASVEEVAKSKVESSKQSVEKTIESKKAEVASRAIEIASELLPKAEADGKKAHILGHAATMSAEKVARQEAITNGTVVVAAVAGASTSSNGSSSSSDEEGTRREPVEKLGAKGDRSSKKQPHR